MWSPALGGKRESILGVVWNTEALIVCLEIAIADCLSYSHLRTLPSMRKVDGISTKLYTNIIVLDNFSII